MANNLFPHNAPAAFHKRLRAIAGLVAIVAALAAGWRWIPTAQDSTDWSIAMDAAPMAQKAVESCVASLDCVNGASAAPSIDLRLMGDDAFYCSPEPCEINSRTRLGVANDGIVIIQHDENGKKVERAFAPWLVDGRIEWRRLPDGIVTMSFEKSSPSAPSARELPSKKP